MEEKKGQSSYGVIRLKAFETTIKWFVGDFDEFEKKYKLKEWNLKDKYLGLTLTCEKYYLIFSDGTDNNNTIPHEVVHAISRMCEHRDILFNETNHEMIAYLVGFVSGKILNEVNKAK